MIGIAAVAVVRNNPKIISSATACKIAVLIVGLLN